jgi:hypothetical protein
VLASEFQYESSPQRLVFTFDQSVGASLAAGDLSVERLGPGGGTVAVLTPTYHGPSRTATVGFEAGILPAGNYRVTLQAGSVSNVVGAALEADYKMEFFVLPADANHNRTVDFSDLVILAQNYGMAGRSFSQGNFNYDPAGNVDFQDLVLLAQRYGTTLPPPDVVATRLSSSDVDSAKDPVFNSVVPVRKPSPTVRKPKRTLT